MIKFLSNIVLCICISVFITSCKSDNFTISGDIHNLGTQNLRMVYITDNAIKSVWLPVVDGKFSFTGNSKELTVVEIYTRQMDVIARIAIEDGEKAEVKGDIKSPYQIKVTGSDTNEEWCKFINDNAINFQKGNRDAIEKAIEKFVKANPDNETSAFLVAYNFATSSNITQAKKLLSTISDSAKPAIIDQRLETISDDDLQPNIAKVNTSFILYSNADSIESFNPSNSKVSLLYFWIPENKERKEVMKQLKNLNRTYAKSKLQIADITLESDSSIWKNEIKSDSVSWKHFWGLGGRTNNAIKKMGVTSAPYYLVIDSAGNPIYRGASLDAACKLVDNKLKK